RAMCTWSHFRFRQHLVHKACEHSWCQIILCTEEYTSKTCGFYGYVYRKLGGSKVFRCPKCKTELDRDINGACNIFLYYLTKKESA
ncbi:34950_t:CDS:1, partial [Gigaspora margarita]